MSIIVNPPPTGGGGGAATIADGADVTQGAKVDAAWDEAAASPSVVAILKRAVTRISAIVSGVGAVGDAAWTSGNGSVVSVLKAIAGSSSIVATTVGTNRINANIQRSSVTAGVPLASGATDSNAIDMKDYIAGGFIIPAAFTGTSVTYKVSQTTTGHQPLRDQYGNLVTTPVAINNAYPFPQEAAGFASLVIVSSAAEGAARTIQTFRKG